MTNADPPYEPRTPLGHRLRAIHEQIVASGAPHFDWEELQREISERRGDRDFGR
jgi:hypothetical protein